MRISIKWLPKQLDRRDGEKKKEMCAFISDAGYHCVIILFTNMLSRYYHTLPFFFSVQIKGQAAEVIGEHCNAEGMKVLKFSEPSGPSYHYDPPNGKSFGDQPLLGMLYKI